MNVTLKIYEPDRNFEDAQANIFNDYLKRYPDSIFAPVTAARIKERNIVEKKDPQLLRYAFREDGTPLAYIQASIKSKTAWIGYPWAFADCPVDVQEQLYQELLTYILEKFPENEIVMGYFSATWEDPKQFALDKGFRLNDTAYFYKIAPKEIRLEIPENFTSRLGTVDDLDSLIALSKADPGLATAFPTDEAREDYFKNRVLADGHLILVFKDQEQLLVAASAPLRGWAAGSYSFHFTAIRPGFEEAWKMLAVSMAKYCAELGWTEKMVVSSFARWNIVEPLLKDLSAELFGTQVQYKLDKK